VTVTSDRGRERAVATMSAAWNCLRARSPWRRAPPATDRAPHPADHRRAGAGDPAPASVRRPRRRPDPGSARRWRPGARHGGDPAWNVRHGADARTVAIEAPFAIGVYEVTRGDWARYAAATGSALPPPAKARPISTHRPHQLRGCVGLQRVAVGPERSPLSPPSSTEWNTPPARDRHRLSGRRRCRRRLCRRQCRRRLPCEALPVL